MEDLFNQISDIWLAITGMVALVVAWVTDRVAWINGQSKPARVILFIGMFLTLVLVLTFFQSMA